jgi:hypothetical protein
MAGGDDFAIQARRSYPLNKLLSGTSKDMFDPYNLVMSSVNRCLYCAAPAASDEHVISEALGCKELIKHAVCLRCNNTFGHTFEGKFINGLALFLNFFKISNGQGVVPSVQLQGKIGSEEFKFVMTGDAKAEIHPKPLRNQETTAPHHKKFRIFHKAQERKIGDALRSRHHDLTWHQLPGTDVKQVIDVEAGFDASMLCTSETNRAVAKYALNLLIHQYGLDWVKRGFRSLIGYVKGEPSDTRVGILWEPSLLKRFPFEPSKHLFVLICDSRTQTATVFLYLFCLFPYCVITREHGILIDSMKNGAVDPYKGRFTPLFLGGSPQMLARQPLIPFPMPEFEFYDLLGRTGIGTLKQATRAAKNAVLFMQSVYSGQPGMPHICYSCKKILRQLTSVCEYCGKSPVPEQTAPSI